ncbi:MAG: ABC transporter ATP-binding protein [Eubacteriales bacterium]|nr:ABC transporter ATP-binding protein [Eubacteriales bacterium]
MSQISAQNVSMSYEKKLVLEGISFEVDQGDYLCIVGENGSGKTTLLRGILGLMPLKSGAIRFGDGVRNNQIGYLPQQTLVQKDFPASVFEVVLSGCLNRIGLMPFYSSREKRKAQQNLELLGIGNLKLKSYKELSGGQQQRVLLARALCATEKIVLLDEPASGLDPIITNEFYQIIRSLNQAGVTIIMISHDVKLAVEYANKILHIGTMSEFFGATEEYLKSEAGRRFLEGGSSGA